MALEALSNVIKHNRGVDIQCIGHFKLLFSLLRLRRCPKIQEMALQVFFLDNFWGLGWVRLTKKWVSGSWILKSQLWG